MDDIKEQAEKVEALFQAAEKGKWVLILSPVVIAEVVFVLETYYRIAIKDVSARIQALLMQTFIEVEHEKAIAGLWQWYENGMHFVDSFLISLKNFENGEIFSFDKKLLKRIEEV